jgi:hypothetical protein
MAGYAAKHWRPTLPLLALSVACTLIACESREQLRQAQEQQCGSYGFQPGTDSFTTCLQRESAAQSYRLNEAVEASRGPPYAYPAYSDRRFWY